MAEVGRVTPAKPVWPGHHSEVVERVTPPKDQEQGKKRQPGDEGAGRHEPGPDDDKQGHVDEYV